MSGSPDPERPEGVGAVETPGPAAAPVSIDANAAPALIEAPAPVEPRPWLERLGLAAIAVVLGALLALVAVAAGTGGEWILAAMAASGAALTFGVGLQTLIRG